MQVDDVVDLKFYKPYKDNIEKYKLEVLKLIVDKNLIYGHLIHGYSW